MGLDRKKEDVPANEARNWPRGGRVSSHKFMDLSESPIVSRPYYNNEELFYFVKIRTEELGGGEAALKQARIELLSVIYPNIDLVNFRADNPDMTDKCCRRIFTLDLDRIAIMHTTHGEAIKFFNCTVAGDIELGEKDDPEWGFEFTNPEEGFPCMNLSRDGCSWHAVDGKPKRCIAYPIRPRDIGLIPTCSYKFNPQGRRTGNCDRCGA